MVVTAPETNHGALRSMMARVVTGEDVPRDEQLALAKRHGQTEQIYDADLQEMRERKRLFDEYWASPEGVAITAAKQKLVDASQALNTAKAEFASTSKVAELEQHRQHASTAWSRLANANSEIYRAFARRMKSTSFPTDDPMAWDNLLIH